MMDIKLISTEELLYELGSRFDSWIFAGQRVGIKSRDNVRTTRRYSSEADHATCLGLCLQMTNVINQDFENASIEAQEDN